MTRKRWALVAMGFGLGIMLCAMLARGLQPDWPYAALVLAFVFGLIWVEVHKP